MHIKLDLLLWPLNNAKYRDVAAQKVKLFTNFSERPKLSGTVPIWLIYGAMESS
jgi:hypothetical protein